MEAIQWQDGWKALQAPDIRQPSIWLINPMQLHKRLAHQDEQVLSSEEISRAARFHRKDHMIRFKMAHMALRFLLGYLTDSDPADLRFEKGHHNKPRLKKAESADIQFNLSYTENRVMIGLNPKHPIGIDIEWIQRPLAIESMLEACFSKNEIAFIGSKKEEMHARFFTLWTRKEAVLKLTGEGIGEHLPHFEVLDGLCRAHKQVIGGQPPDYIHLYSVALEEGFLGCMASSDPIQQCFFYRL